MITSIISIGNSKGIRIPKNALKESGITDKVELKIKAGEIKIIPIKNIVNDTSLLAEASLGRDWNRPEEDEAWNSLN